MKIPHPYIDTGWKKKIKKKYYETSLEDHKFILNDINNEYIGYLKRKAPKGKVYAVTIHDRPHLVDIKTIKKGTRPDIVISLNKKEKEWLSRQLKKNSESWETISKIIDFAYDKQNKKEAVVLEWY